MQVSGQDLFEMECSTVNMTHAQELPGTWTIEINPDSAEVDSGTVSWKYSATMELIQYVGQMREQFASPNVKKSEVWKKIARMLSAKGFPFSWEQCDKKWRSLKYRFKMITDQISRLGMGRKKWEFFDVMAEILSDDPAVRPLLTITSRNGSKRRVVKGNDDPDPAEPAREESVPTSTPPPPQPPPPPPPPPPPQSSQANMSTLETTQQEQLQEESQSGRRKRKRAATDSEPPEWFIDFAEKQLQLLNSMKESMDRRNRILEDLVNNISSLVNH